jgi:hypothetical protein
MDDGYSYQAGSDEIQQGEDAIEAWLMRHALATFVRCSAIHFYLTAITTR